MFSVAKKSFEEYLFWVHFRAVILSLGNIGGDYSGFAKTGVVFSDTSFIGASFSVTSFYLPTFYGFFAACFFPGWFFLPRFFLFGNGGSFADCFLYGCYDFIRLFPPVHCPNAADVPAECFQYIVLDNLTVACGFRTFVVLSVTDDT